MTVVDVLTDTYTILKNNLIVIVPNLLFIVLAGVFLAVILVALFSLGLVSGPQQSANPIVTALGVLLIIFFVVYLLAALFVQLMYISMGLSAFKKKISLNDAFGAAKKSFFRALGVAVIYAILYGVILLLLYLLLLHGKLAPLISTVASNSTNSSINSTASGHILSSPAIQLFVLLFTFALLFAAISVLISPFLYLATTFVVAEGLGPVDAIRKSIETGKRMYLSLLGLVVLSVVLITVISFIVDIIPYIGILLNIVVSLFTSAWSSMLAPVFYQEYIKKLKLKA